MLVVALVPALVMVVGLLLYALAANPKVSEVGRTMFWVGLFWTVGALSSSTLRLGSVR